MTCRLQYFSFNLKNYFVVQTTPLLIVFCTSTHQISTLDSSPRFLVLNFSDCLLNWGLMSDDVQRRTQDWDVKPVERT